jgi:hypothetical protein
MIKLGHIHVWVCISRIPEHRTKKEILWDLATRIGDVVKVELTLGKFGVDYVQARVKVDVNMPLSRLVMLTPEASAPMFLCICMKRYQSFAKCVAFWVINMRNVGLVCMSHMHSNMGTTCWRIRHGIDRGPRARQYPLNPERRLFPHVTMIERRVRRV